MHAGDVDSDRLTAQEILDLHTTDAVDAHTARGEIGHTRKCHRVYTSSVADRQNIAHGLVAGTGKSENDAVYT